MNSWNACLLVFVVFKHNEITRTPTQRDPSPKCRFCCSFVSILGVWDSIITIITHGKKHYTGWPKKPRTVDFLGLCSDQQLSFYTLLDRPSFPHYNNTKIIKFGWELFILWVISPGGGGGGGYSPNMVNGGVPLKWVTFSQKIPKHVWFCRKKIPKHGVYSFVILLYTRYFRQFRR